ncbi:MAG: hypothetical protein ABFE08_09085 [Armatimonadia bacterium]
MSTTPQPNNTSVIASVIAQAITQAMTSQTSFSQATSAQVLALLNRASEDIKSASALLEGDTAVVNAPATPQAEAAPTPAKTGFWAKVGSVAKKLVPYAGVAAALGLTGGAAAAWIPEVINVLASPTGAGTVLGTGLAAGAAIVKAREEFKAPAPTLSIK